MTVTKNRFAKPVARGQHAAREDIWKDKTPF